MALKLIYMGQNDSVNCTPNVALVGDPGTDQTTLTNAGFVGGALVQLVTGTQPTNQPAFGLVGNIALANGDTAATPPIGALLNGPGEFAGAIGPSGSHRAPIVRAFWQGLVTSENYVASDIASFAMGAYVYCGNAANKGKYVSSAGAIKGSQNYIVGICTHIPTAAEPWLGVASLI